MGLAEDAFYVFRLLGILKARVLVKGKFLGLGLGIVVV